MSRPIGVKSAMQKVDVSKLKDDTVKQTNEPQIHQYICNIGVDQVTRGRLGRDMDLG